ncbi:GSCOCG00011915001-RA-CDS [Cotesia congregata]|nr:GSCOCG00011915001-RA-CDS [Cotesia congregata]
MFLSLLRDWKYTFRTFNLHRGGISPVRIYNLHLITVIVILLITFFLYNYLSTFNTVCYENDKLMTCLDYYKYNSTYPLTAPIAKPTGISYRIAIISDLDLKAKSLLHKSWISFLKKGILSWDPHNDKIHISWEKKELLLSSSFVINDRGMELSELITFDGRLLSFDDRTGIVYDIEDKAYPWTILIDGDGRSSKGFKSEWATVKNNFLYVGSIGKEWTSSSGEFIHNNPMWIKIISPRGEVKSVNWINNYKKLRQAVNIEFPGYMIHESGVWSNIHKCWFFIPRRCSVKQYNETEDEKMSCNVLLKADEEFNHVEVTQLNNWIPIRGFSSFKFLPGSEDKIIIALKTEEYQSQTATYITAFTINGKLLLPDLKIGDYKYEGFEFI